MKSRNTLGQGTSNVKSSAYIYMKGKMKTRRKTRVRQATQTTTKKTTYETTKTTYKRTATTCKYPISIRIR